MLDQPVRILTHLKEVGFLPGRRHRPSAIRTFAVHQLRLRKERFTGRTVHSLIIPLINISLFIELLKNLLHLFFMIIIRGADKFIIGSVHQIPDPLDLPGCGVHKLLRRHTGILRLQFNLLTVFIGSGLKEYIVPLGSLKAGDTVRQHDLIGVADVGLAGCISNGSSHIILFLFHVSSPLIRRKTRSVSFPCKSQSPPSDHF